MFFENKLVKWHIAKINPSKYTQQLIRMTLHEGLVIKNI
jgi:hypothetical protein